MEVKTTEDARNYFKNKGLSYNDINLVQFMALKEMVSEELSQNNYLGMKLTKNKVKYEPKIDTLGLINGFIRVDGSYFKEREAISFNDDGFIGFAGWADSNNVSPFIRAFTRWTDSLYKKGKVTKEILRNMRDETIRDIAVCRLLIPKRYINRLYKNELVEIIYGRTFAI